MGEALAFEDHEHGYERLLAAVQDAFGAAVRRGPLFTTWQPAMFDRFIEALPMEIRQSHRCQACRRFFDQFGGLVTISQDGRQLSAVWDVDNALDPYLSAVALMQEMAETGRVTGPFYPASAELGSRLTGNWTHLAVAVEAGFRVKTSPAAIVAGQRENFHTLTRALGDYPADLLLSGMRLLETGQVDRAERFIAPLRWLWELQKRCDAVHERRCRANLIWLAVVAAPEGYCHLRGSVIGSLLDDLIAGGDAAGVVRRFNAKVAGHLYQRPVAPPKAGTIAAAERLVLDLGLRPSFDRRIARPNEIEAIWRPAQAAAADDGDGTAPASVPKPLFAHLRPTRQAPLLPSTTLTWEKFRRTVMPSAERITISLGYGPMPFYAFTTASDPNAPPLLRWDRAERRNPVAWYMHHPASAADMWDVQIGEWRQVLIVAELPPMWGDQPMPHLFQGVVLVIDGARDTTRRAGSPRELGNALFPEFLREELFMARSVVEAHSRATPLQFAAAAADGEREWACGIGFTPGEPYNFPHTLRVSHRDGGPQTMWRIDRWD